MAEASYERQHLALHAAGSISGGSGSSQVTFGCEMTRISGGHYALLLDANSGLINDESFTFVTVKSPSPRFAVVEDLSNTEKRIRVFDDTGSSATPDAIEVALFKSVTH